MDSAPDPSSRTRMREVFRRIGTSQMDMGNLEVDSDDTKSRNTKCVSVGPGAASG
jgi:hypothetical protein